MKKFFLMMVAVLAVSLVGCDSTESYKIKGEKLAKELDRLCELKDSAAVVALDDSISAMEARIVAEGDSLSIAQFQEALKESRVRNAPYIATLKMKSGKPEEEVIKDMAGEVMKGNIDIATITSAIDEMNESAAE